MKRSLWRTLVLYLFLAAARGLAAADMYTYVVVLHDRVAAGEAPEPQIAAADGEVLHRFENQRVVRVTAPAARTLALHPEVRYIQRVQVAGEVPPLLHSVGGAASAIAANDWAPPTWASGDYVYDGEGNIIAIGTTASPASDGGTESYVYDSAGRLVSASISHGATQSEQYTYDSFGNLVATTRTAGPSTATPASLATNRLTTATYDAAGNVTANESGTTEYHYDSFNMLRAKVTSTSSALYVYTADDERIGVYENGEQRWMIRDLSGKVLREWRDGGLVWLWREDYVYRNGALAAAEREPAEGGTRHYHLDHLGTPRLITDAARRKIALYDYFPFGVEKTDFRQEMLERGTKWPEDMKFTGHERDFTGGTASNNRNQLDYMHARYYSPTMGRFFSVDPAMDVERNLRTPQRWNRYAYAMNNPVKYVDPDGMTERTGWQAGVVVNKSNQVIWIAADHNGAKIVIPLRPGERSTLFLVDTDAVIIGPGQKIDGERTGAFKIGSSDVDVEGKSVGKLALDVDGEWVVNAAAGRAGHVSPTTALQNGWVIPAGQQDAQAAEKTKQQLQQERQREERKNKPQSQPQPKPQAKKERDWWPFW